MTNRKLLSRTGSISAAMLLASVAGAQVNFPEVEPNDAKTNANLFTMACGDTITGNTTGTSTTAPGPASADTFRIRTISTGVPVFYTLTMTRDDNVLPAHTLTIRGLNQVTGVPGTTDSIMTTAVTVGTTKVASWYGTGPAGANQDIYVRVTGTSATTVDYRLRLTCSPVTLNTVPGSSFAGDVTVRPDAATDTAIDTDYWVFDSSFNAIPDFGHDDVDGTGVVRTLSPGTYHAALGNYNTCTNLGSPADDTFRSAIVMDFPNVLVNNTTGALSTMNFRVTDGFNDNTGLGSRAGSFQVAWHSFTVISTPYPTGTGVASPNVIKQGDSTLLTVNVTPVGAPNPSTGLTVVADLSALGGSASQSLFDNGTNGDVTPGDNVFSYLFTPAGYGTATLPFTVSDAQARSSNGSMSVTSRQVIDVGSLPVGMTSPAPVNLAAGEVKFYKFTLANPVSNADLSWLDISNPGPSGGDTEFGVYRADGSLVVSDDQDGDNNLAALSFGQTSPTRPGQGNGVVNNGRDGSLTAGTYYLAIGMFNVTFGATNFGATSTGPAATGFAVGFDLGRQSNPFIVGNPASGSVGGTVLLTATATPGIDPPSATLAVTGNLTSIGGSASQTFYDNGTNGDVTAGDNVFSYLATIPHAPAQGAGVFNCPLSIIDDQSRTGSGSIAVTLAAEALGQCCTAGACSIATAFNCAGGGGTYGGDGTTCEGTLTTLGTSGNGFPIAIPGPVTSGVTPGVANATITFPPGSGTANNLAVVVGINHTWIGDIHMSLTKDATTVDLVYRPEVLIQTTDVGSDANYNGTYVFADMAAGDIWAIVFNTPSTFDVPAGNYHPSSMGSGAMSSPSLAAFNGASLEGTWTLRVEDWWTGDVGNVNSFALATMTPVDCAPACGTSDFDGDGDFGTDADIEAFFACLAGNCCPTCYPGGSDFNADGDYGTDADIESFFRVLAGGPC